MPNLIEDNEILFICWLDSSLLQQVWDTVNEENLASIRYVTVFSENCGYSLNYTNTQKETALKD